MGDVIDDHEVEWNSSKKYNKFLHRTLPEGVTDVETVLYHQDPSAIQEMPTFASVNYVSDDEDEDDHDHEDNGPPPLKRRDSSSSDSEDEEDQATKTARSKNKMMRAMKKISGTSYNPLPGRVLQAGTYRPTRSSRKLGRNRNIQEFGNLLTDFQGMDEEISEIGKNYKEPKNFQEAWNHPDPIQRKLWRTAITKEDHKLYRSGVGMLLYLVKYSRPDIANPVRELSKVLDSPTPASFKEMLRVIKYVLDTKEYGLRVHPTKSKDEMWELISFCDSDYATDPDSRKSVTGYVLYVKGVPVCWKSKAQRSVTLSSTEAEWIALSEATKEIIFVLQLLESLGIKVNLPITVRVDNTGAIFMSKNINTTSGTKHVDVRTKYVNQYCEDGIVKIIFVESANNDADIFTKNLGQELHNKHSSKLISAKNQAV